MNISRFREIIRYSNINRERIAAKVRDFYAFIGMNEERELLNLLQVVRPLLEQKNYIIIELPFSDDEIGALCYKGDSLGYIFLNTSLPKVNVNFALAHEIYHVFYQNVELRQKVELYINERYYERDEELAANLFAGMLLMPEQSFRFMYNKFKSEAKGNDVRLSVLVQLMSYFEVPYMAVLIRSYELKLLESGELLEELIKTDSDGVKNEISRLWLDDSILNATKKDDYGKLESMVASLGKKYQEEEYLNERTINKVLKNMRELYGKIKGE